MTVRSAPSADTGERLSLSSGRLTLLGVGAVLCMLFLGGAALVEARKDAWRQAQLQASNLLLALDRDIARNVTILDLSLQGAMEALAEPGIAEATPGVRHHALFDRSASAEDLGSILVLNEKGFVVEDSTSIHPHSLNLSDRDYFKIHETNPDRGLYVSRPFQSRLAGGDLRFAISRRLPDVDGKFAGVVEGTLRLNYFKRLFETIQLGSHGSITMLLADGHLLLRSPFAATEVGRDVSHTSNFKRFIAEREGQYIAKASFDGVERLISFRHIGDLPLILTVNMSIDDIYGPWRRKALVIGPVLLLLCAMAITSCMLFRREVFRRADAERALAAAAEKLTIIASTDSLTGLSNRRTFETEITRAFRHATRTQNVVAVLMLDADCFKLYNDRYGHQAGDHVLQELAKCIARNVQRPGDVAARYGGEEFIVMLPETDEPAAQIVAERIRVAIERLMIEHADNAAGIVTVSIGIASAWPQGQPDEATRLVQRADDALYRAKRSGRNRTATSAIAEVSAEATLKLVGSRLEFDPQQNEFHS